MFSRIKKEGQFEFGPGIKSHYNYDYASLSDTMNEAYCAMLVRKLEAWQKEHGNFEVVVGIETEGIRIGYTLAKMMNLKFYIMPHRRIELEQLGVPKYPADTHWLIVDDIVTTGSQFMRTVDYLDIEETPETITYACMIKRNPANLDFSAVSGSPDKEQKWVRTERFDFVDKRLVALYSED
ncbi:phosphoribosyltransferase [Nitrospina sp. 32_T5]|uniref:phosphoribosyltransferase n=1 Tax=unclassified Nitrospina TaxID=2638683 RepID=UPI003F9A204B